jgi:hypothetical protein
MYRFLPLLLLLSLTPTAADASGAAGPVIFLIVPCVALLVLFGVICGCIASRYTKGPHLSKLVSFMGGLVLSLTILALIYFDGRAAAGGGSRFLYLSGPFSGWFRSTEGLAFLIFIIPAATTFAFSRLGGELKKKSRKTS